MTPRSRYVYNVRDPQRKAASFLVLRKIRSIYVYERGRLI